MSAAADRPGDAIATDQPTSADVRTLLERHLALMHRNSPPEDVHALDVQALLDPAVTFVSYRRDGRLLGVGALKELDPGHGELKSMHTAIEARGAGVGRALLDHLLGLARARGYRRVSLETGTAEAFLPARSLYVSAGFEPCEPFNGYSPSPYSTFLTLALC